MEYKIPWEFLIHAAKKIMVEDCKKFGFDPDMLTTGAIIGKAYLYDVKVYKNAAEWASDSDKHLAGMEFASSTNGFLLRNAGKFPDPMPIKGKLNFFEVVPNLGWWL